MRNERARGETQRRLSRRRRRRLCLCSATVFPGWRVRHWRELRYVLPRLSITGHRWCERRCQGTLLRRVLSVMRTPARVNSAERVRSSVACDVFVVRFARRIKIGHVAGIEADAAGCGVHHTHGSMRLTHQSCSRKEAAFFAESHTPATGSAKLVVKRSKTYCTLCETDGHSKRVTPPVSPRCSQPWRRYRLVVVRESEQLPAVYHLAEALQPSCLLSLRWCLVRGWNRSLCGHSSHVAWRTLVSLYCPTPRIILTSQSQAAFRRTRQKVPCSISCDRTRWCSSP
jgi:hypothetical protein